MYQFLTDHFSELLTIGGIILLLILIWTDKIKTDSFNKLLNLTIKQSYGSGKSATPMLDIYTIDFTKQQQTGAKDPIIGREQEISKVIQILSRRTKNNAILLGDPGVGKTAIVEGLAQRIAQKNVPDVLQGKRLLSLQVATLLAGTKYRGEFEERAKKIVQEISIANRSIILFIDEIHTVIQSQGSEGSVNFADILKPALARGDLQMIGATTTIEYDKYIKSDSSLERRFQPVEINEPTPEQTVAILQGIKEKYQEFHKVEFTDEAIRAAVTLSDKYIKNRKLPDKAIDIIDEAAAMVKVSHTDKIAHGLLHQAAKDKQPELNRIWKELQLTDTRIAQAQHNDLEHFVRYRDDLKKQLDASGIAVVDVTDIEKVVHDWSQNS